MQGDALQQEMQRQWDDAHRHCKGALKQFDAALVRTRQRQRQRPESEGGLQAEGCPPSLLSALADELCGLRETCLEACQGIQALVNASE